MDKSFMTKVLENIFFVATEPVMLSELKGTFQIESEGAGLALIGVLKGMQADYQKRGLELKEVAEGYLLNIQDEYAKWSMQFQQNTPVKLTEEARVCLAIVAYQQPVKREEIEAIRSVECKKVLQTLLGYGLIQVVGEVAGAHLYCTTRKFLTGYGLNSLSDLPPLDGIFGGG